jgi:hypothetical protein
MTILGLYAYWRTMNNNFSLIFKMKKKTTVASTIQQTEALKS